MTFPKLLLILTVVLFGTIGTLAFVKSGKKSPAPRTFEVVSRPIEVHLDGEVKVLAATPPIPVVTPVVAVREEPAKSLDPLPEADRIQEFFNKSGPKFPIVETITYKSRVPWQKGRPAWLSDYASHYATSRHFIARSLNGKPDYFKQDISEGDRFNVLKQEKNVEFYLLIDLTRSKMWFYYLDLDQNERVLVKSYTVGLGRVDPSSASGLLTPLGKFGLGDKIAIYKPKAMGMHNGQKIEMVRVFGTRWIPFEKELGDNTAAAKGLGIHGVPWVADANGQLVEDSASLSKYESDGCVRLATRDIEELFAIIITKPTTIELVRDYYEASLPGLEK